LSGTLKTTECAKRAENFFTLSALMTVDADLVEDVSSEFSNLRITPDCEGEISPMSDQEGKSKRSRGEFVVSNLLARSGTFLDPLLYLRVKHDTGCSNESETRQSTPPTLDEILEFSKQIRKPLVEPVVRPKKHKLPTSSSENKASGVKTSSRPSPKLPVAVFRFCREHSVRHVPLSINKTYRSIAFRKSTKVPDTWAEYMEVNHLSHYRLCHAMMFACTNSSKRIVVIVPHSKSQVVNIDALAIIFPNLPGPVKRLSLTNLEKEFGFPTFINPPFGHGFAPNMYNKPESDRSEIFTVIDSRLVVEGTTDCFFDLGIVGMIIRPAELGRLARSLNWTILDQIVKN